MRVELFQVPGCTQCAGARDRLRSTALEVDQALEWRELNPLEDIEYAVQLGVLTLPAVAIDGALVFSGLPTPSQLRQALTRHRPRGR